MNDHVRKYAGDCWSSEVLVGVIPQQVSIEFDADIQAKMQAITWYGHRARVRTPPPLPSDPDEPTICGEK